MLYYIVLVFLLVPVRPYTIYDRSTTVSDVSSSVTRITSLHGVTDDTEEPPIIPAKGDVNPVQPKAENTGLGPWTITMIAVAVVVALAIGIFLGVTVNRQRKLSSYNSDSEKGQRGQQQQGPIKFVPPGDDSWRGPSPFYERVFIPAESDTESTNEEFDDEMTILEPPLKPKTG